MRRRAKLDANHKQIVEGLRKAGFSVQSLAEVGGGCPDLLISRAGWNVLFEVKQPGERLNAIQQKWHDAWAGQVNVVFGLEHALELLGRRPRI